MATSPSIAVMAGDRGGWNSFKPVIDLALERGHQVAVFLTATCSEQRRGGRLEIDQRVSVTHDNGHDELSSFMRLPHDLLIVCASQSHSGAAPAARAMMETDRPVLALQDAYGSLVPFLELTASWEGIRTICVTDDFSRAHLLKSFQNDFSPATVVVTGGPQFDYAAEVRRQWKERRAELRSWMGVSGADPIVLIAGQLNGTAEAVTLAIHALQHMQLRGSIVCRVHPRQTLLDQQLFAYCRSAISTPWFVDPGMAHAPNSEAVLPGVDFVLSGYSTTNYYGILYQMPGVVYLGTPSFYADLHKEKGLKQPIEVDLGAGWYVRTVDQLVHVMTEVRKGDQSEGLRQIQSVQAKIAAANDGQAAQRVMNEIERLLAS